MGTIECDRIKGERERKAASQGGSLLQGFQTSSGWPSAFLVILGEFEVIHTLIFLFHLPVSFFLFLITVSWKKCSGHPLCLREWHWKFHSLLWRTSELSLKARGSKKGSKHFFFPRKRRKGLYMYLSISKHLVLTRDSSPTHPHLPSRVSFVFIFRPGLCMSIMALRCFTHLLTVLTQLFPWQVTVGCY